MRFAFTLCLLLSSVAQAAAQDRPFLLSVATAQEPDGPALRLLQKPFDPKRDAIDLITSVGWAVRITPSVAVGLEGIAEDVEGFWEAEEAEGGARLLAGPSLHIAPRGRRWQLNATGGPTFHPADTGRASGTFRDLPAHDTPRRLRGEDRRHRARFLTGPLATFSDRPPLA